MDVGKRRTGFIALLLFTAALIVAARFRDFAIDKISPPVPPPPLLTINIVPQTEVVEDTVQKNRTLVATLVDYEVPVAIANEIADLIKPVFDVRKLRFGNPFRLEKEHDGTLKKFEYKIDDERVLKVQKGQDADYEAHV